MQLSNEGSREINEQADRREILLIERSLKSEHRYQFVLRLKAIKYKKLSNPRLSHITQPPLSPLLLLE